MKINNIFYKYIFELLLIFEFFLIIYFIDIKFETDDDPAMNLIASGSYTGHPSEFIIFSSILIGSTLKWFYNLNLNINWYAWYLIISLYLCYFSFQVKIMNIINCKFLLKLTIHLLIFQFFISIFSELQFTRIAAILSLVGIFLIICFDEKRYLLIGALLMILGSLIRIDMFYLLLVITFPFIIYIIVKKRKVRVLTLLLSIIFCISFAFINNYVYKNNLDFKDYKKFNRIQYKITIQDNPSFKYEKVKGILEKVNWSYNDYDLASNFNFDYGGNKFNAKNLLLINSEIEKLQNEYSIGYLFLTFKQTFIFLSNYIFSNIIYLLFVFPLAVIIIKGEFTKIFIILLYFFYITILLTFFKIFELVNIEKSRVIWSFILPLMLIIFLLNFIKIRNYKVFKNTKFKNTNLYPLMILCSIFSIIFKDNNKNKTNQLIQKTIDSQKDSFYISWCGYQKNNIFEMPSNFKNAYFMGWYVGTPFNKKKVSDYVGKKCDGIYGIFNKKIIWYFHNNNWWTSNMKIHIKVLNFYKSNYDSLEYNFEKLSINDKDTLFKYTFKVFKEKN